MNAYAENDIAIEIGELEKQRDYYKGLLEWVGNPKNPFNYSIWADGRVMISKPNSCLCPNLISAIEYARYYQTNRQIPL